MADSTVLTASMLESFMRHSFGDGKYTVTFDTATGRLAATRYNEDWRDLSGDKLVLAMLQEVDSLKRTIRAMERCQTITTDRLAKLEHDSALLDFIDEKAVVGADFNMVTLHIEHDGGDDLATGYGTTRDLLADLKKRTEAE